MKIKIRPLFGKILVKPDDKKKENKTKSGIIMPDDDEKQKYKGTVVKLSAGKERIKNGTIIPFDVKKGDKIIYSTYGGAEIKDEDDQIYLVISEEDILGVINND